MVPDRTTREPQRPHDPWRGLLDPVLLSRLGNVALRARLVVEGALTGLHRSPYRGLSVEFAEHRAYIPGDSLRHLDWKVYARSERLYVKEFEEETNLRCYLLVDASASMGYGPAGMSKLSYATTMAAALAYLMIRQGDSVGLHVFSERTTTFLPARSVPTHLGSIFDGLESLTASGGTGIGAAFQDLAGRIRRRGLVILISDLISPAEELALGLSHFIHKKHEVVVMHLLHPWEIGLPYQGTVLLRDPESGVRSVAQPAVVRRDYRRNLDDYLDERRRVCQSKKADYVRLTTDTPLDRALLGYLERRARSTW